MSVTPYRAAPTGRAIGIFGGTFDPVHHGHLRIALDALEALRLDHVRLIPLAQAVHREQPQTPAPLRLAMLEAAVAGHPELQVDNRELRRDGPSYTIDTLRSLQHDFPDHRLHLLLGGDAFRGFARWRDPVGILALANVVVLRRPGSRPVDWPDISALQHEKAAEESAVTELAVTQLDIASSDIRQRISSGRRADFLVPDPVLDLIRQNRLYQIP